MNATAEVTELRPPPDDSVRTFTCDDCGDSFPTPQARGAHRRYKHGNGRTASAPSPKAKPAKPAAKRTAKRVARPKLDTKSVRKTLQDDYDPWLLVVGHLDDNGAKAETVVLSTENDARQVAELITTLGHKPHVFRLADGR